MIRMDKRTYWITICALIVMLIVSNGIWIHVVFSPNITINTPTKYVYDGTNYAATIDYTTIGVAKGNVKVSLNGQDKSVSTPNGTIIFRPSSTDGEVYYTANGDEFELKVFSAGVINGQYAFQEYVCANPYNTDIQYSGIDSGLKNFSCADSHKQIVLDPHKVYFFWGKVGLSYANGSKAEINQSSDHLMVVRSGIPTTIIAVWQNSQGGYTTASSQNYQQDMCNVLHAQNYGGSEILPVWVNIVVPNVSQSTC